MLGKSERLKDRYLFDVTFKIGKTKRQKLSSKYLLLYYLFTKKDHPKCMPKTAFIVGLKVDKRATQRNLIKRRMRASYQLIKKKLINLNKNNLFALIWIANPEANTASYKEINQTMEKMLTSIVRKEA